MEPIDILPCEIKLYQNLSGICKVVDNFLLRKVKGHGHCHQNSIISFLLQISSEHIL